MVVAPHVSISLSVAAALLMSSSADLTWGDNDRSIAITLKEPVHLVKTTAGVSPPTLRFSREGILHVAWIEKNGQQGDVKTAEIPFGEPPTSLIQVNQGEGGPEAAHQSPGFAIGPSGTQFLTWSSAHRTASKGVESLFASDLQLTRSSNGQTFHPPVQVNDDGLPISHSFEDLYAGNDQAVYVAWLDGRNKDQSGASAMFACSSDNGFTMGKNVVIDRMACPCCRPMLAQAPDGTIWVAWRKTFDGKVRDIVVAQSTDRGRSFSSPRVVNQDGWVFEACPHRGPSIAFDGQGRLYIGWYTEGKDEQPQIFIATSDDQGATFSRPVALHSSITSLPDNLHMAVHPDGRMIAVWEEVTGVRKRVVMRQSDDRGRTFGPMSMLSGGSKAEHPTVAIHDSGTIAIGWMEYAFPYNKIIVQEGQLKGAAAK